MLAPVARIIESTVVIVAAQRLKEECWVKPMVSDGNNWRLQARCISLSLLGATSRAAYFGAEIFALDRHFLGDVGT